MGDARACLTPIPDLLLDAGDEAVLRSPETTFTAEFQSLALPVVPFRVTIDVERYRERRREYLGALALRVADKVKKTGRAVALNPMNPRDRRIVHLSLQADRAVSTRSHGEGHYRKIVIAPTERPRRARQDPSGV